MSHLLSSWSLRSLVACFSHPVELSWWSWCQDFSTSPWIDSWWLISKLDDHRAAQSFACLAWKQLEEQRSYPWWYEYTQISFLCYIVGSRRSDQCKHSGFSYSFGCLSQLTDSIRRRYEEETFCWSSGSKEPSSTHSGGLLFHYQSLFSKWG